MLLLNVLLTLSLSTSSLEYHHRLLPTTSSPSSQSLPSFLSTFMVVLSVADDDDVDDVDDDDNDNDTDMNPLQIRLFVSLSMKMKRFLCFFLPVQGNFWQKLKAFI